MRSIGVIGAGIAGLACAQKLRQAGLEVTVLEKSRGVGGRVSTRRTEGGPTFDHGAQYFTARDPIFLEQVQQWCAAGAAAIWQGQIVSLQHGAITPLHEPRDRYVGTPGMNAITKALASGTAVRTGVMVKALARDQQRWQAIDDTGETHGPFDILISTAPPVQSHALLAAHAPSLAATIAPVTMAPCWAVMLQLSERLPTSYDGAFVHNSPLSWIARNSSKPQRDAADCWVLHASADWSREHLEVAPDAALAALVDALGEATQQSPQVSFALAHRWRYALPVEPLHERCLFDRDLQIGACGDWCGGPRVEGAYLSGIAMADACLAEPS